MEVKKRSWIRYFDWMISSRKKRKLEFLSHFPLRPLPSPVPLPLAVLQGSCRPVPPPPQVKGTE